MLHFHLQLLMTKVHTLFLCESSVFCVGDVCSIFTGNSSCILYNRAVIGIIRLSDRNQLLDRQKHSEIYSMGIATPDFVS